MLVFHIGSMGSFVPLEHYHQVKAALDGQAVEVRGFNEFKSRLGFLVVSWAMQKQ